MAPFAVHNGNGHSHSNPGLRLDLSDALGLGWMNADNDALQNALRSPSVAMTPVAQTPTTEAFSKAVGDHLPRQRRRRLPSEAATQEQPLCFSNVSPCEDIFSAMGHFSSNPSSTVGSSMVSEEADFSYFSGTGSGLTSRTSSPAPINSIASEDDDDTSSTKTKTVLCKYFLNGDCSKGRTCSFAHGNNDLRNVNDNDDDSNEGVNTANPNRKTKLCRNLFEEHFCPFDVNCNFAHSLDELKRTPGHIKGLSEVDNKTVSKPQRKQHQIEMPALKRLLPLSAVAIGNCAKEAQQPNDPKLYKTRMCKHFVKTGRCWLQADCRFAHGPEELRASNVH